MSNSVTPWTVARQASLSFTISQSWLKLMSIESVMSSNFLILCCPLLLLPSIFPGQHQCLPVSQLFTSGGQSTGALASASVLPMNTQGLFPLGLTGLISFAVQETLKSLLQHSLQASLLWCSAFFMDQLSHLYMTTGKTTALPDWLAYPERFLLRKSG